MFAICVKEALRPQVSYPKLYLTDDSRACGLRAWALRGGLLWSQEVVLWQVTFP